jgi:tetratricopeptide (TPR) repeat protein
MADATAILGFVDEMAGRYAAAESRYEQALPIYQENEDRYHYAEYFSQLAGLVLLKGELAHAKQLIEGAVALAQQLSNPVVQNVPYGTLGMIHNLEEDYLEAIRQTLKIPDADTTQSFVFYQPKGLAYAHCGLGDFSTAKCHLHAAFDTAVKNDAIGWQVQCLPAAALVAASEDKLVHAAELLSLAYHHPAGATGWLEKFPLVFRLRERLETELSSETFSAAWERGKTLDLDTTITSLLSENQIDTTK